VLFVSYFEDKNDLNFHLETKVKLFLRLSISLAIIGVLFKVMHWEFRFVGGNVQLTVGLLAAAVLVFVGATSEEP